MAIEINSVIIGGNLTRDVEVKEIGAGRRVATFSVANNRTYISNGAKNSDVSYIDVDVWGASGDNCAKYLQKGSPVVVTGTLKQERWKATDGTSRSRFKVVAQNVQFLSFGNDGDNQTSEPTYTKQAEGEPVAPAAGEPGSWE